MNWRRVRVGRQRAVENPMGGQVPRIVRDSSLGSETLIGQIDGVWSGKYGNATVQLTIFGALDRIVKPLSTEKVVSSIVEPPILRSVGTFHRVV